MSIIITRSAKGSPLSFAEADANIVNLNTDKYQSGDSAVFSSLTATGTITLGGATTSTTSLGTTATTGTILIGGTTQTGVIVIGRSTAAQTLNLGTGTTTNGTTKTINIGTAGVSGSTTTINIGSTTSGALGNISIGNGGTQFLVAPTSSAVNYVQVTGSVTTPSAFGLASISVQGLDSSTSMGIGVKGTSGYIAFYGANATNAQVFRVSAANATSAGTANFLQVTASAAGSGPVLSSQGSDTNIDLAITPKGTGLVRFGTRTATSDTPITGYIEIKDSAGNIRRLAVIN